MNRSPHRLPCSTDPEVWYDDQRIADAKTGCAGCPLRAACLDLAIQASEPWGVWGGYTAPERSRLADGRAPSVCDRCGLDYVPWHATSTSCDVCTRREGARIADDLPRIRALVAAGWSTPRIAAELGWKPWRVGAIRARHKIPDPKGGQKPIDLKPCGTAAAARRHYRNGEKPCEACAQVEQRRRKPDKRTGRNSRSTHVPV